MEYLQQGLERFRQEHVSDAKPPQRQAGSPKPLLPPIVYTATKTIELTDHTMRTQHLIAGYEGGPFVDSYKIDRKSVV